MSWNKSAERIFGYSKEEAVGQSVTILLPENRLDEEKDILQQVKSGNRVDHFETVRRRKTGEMVDVSVTISPIRDSQGTVVGASNVARDIGEMKRGNRAGLLLAAIVNSSEDAIISKNLRGIITSWNTGATRLFGYSEDEAIGRSVVMLMPEDRIEEEPKIIARIQKGERVEHFETVRRRKDGTLVEVSLTISPVKDDSGKIVGASKIARDISELKRISKEREQLLESERIARGQAERANRMKDEFLATVSHELRTPLNAIVGWTQVLRESKEATNEIQTGVDVIERSAMSLARLVEDLLDLSQITSGKMILDVQQLDICALLREVLLSVQHASELKQIQLRTIINGKGPMMGDQQRLQQILWNLLSNAIKFTQKGGKVEVSAMRINSHWEIAVSDNGKGISPDFLPHVFERFSQADSSTSRRYSGLGIGLALVKQLVELHGGEIRAESLGVDKGSTFTVSLPLLVARNLEASLFPSHRTPQAPVQSSELAGISVLAVDDDEESLKILQRILSTRGAEVRVASSAETALELIGSFSPHVILSDIGMPGQDGYQLIRKIRGIPEMSMTPAAALTALARPEDRMQALDAGFQTHLSKPVAPAELVAVVRSLATLNRRRST
jgi:PAS domain S-box-containing protein